MDESAKKLYQDFINNHPTIHTNRFPAWDELSEAGKKEWYKAAEWLEDDGA